MTTTPSSRVTVITKGLRIGLIAVILATVVPYGAVHAFWFYLAVLMNALVFTATLAIPFRNLELLRVYRTALVVILLITGYLLLQSMPLPQNALTNSIWQTVGVLLNIEGGTISVNPAGTIAAIPQVIHPFVIFMATLVLHQNNEAAIVFWRRLSLIGAGVAVFGIAQHILLPEWLLLGDKKYYLDSVTGTFINRNSAATLFGVTALLLAAILVRQFHDLPEARDPSDLTEHRIQQEKMVFLYYLGFFVVVLLAGFLTKSRGGLISTFVPLLLLAAWFGFSLAPGASARIRVGIAGAAVTIMTAVFAVLGARSLVRIEQNGVEDTRLCVYRSAITAIKDHPWLGTGFGTFEQVFPAYRNPECGISGLWDRAHNSFLEGYLGMGLPFAAIVLFVIAYLLSIFSTGYRARRRYRIFPLAGMGMLLLILLHSMVDFSLQIPGVSTYVAAALATAVTISLARRRSGRNMTIELE